MGNPPAFPFLLIRLMGSFFRKPGVTVLTYHSIDESGSTLSVTPSAFERQMRYLKENRFPVLPLSQIARILKARVPFPRNTVSLTFDDGYRNTYGKAFPVLQAYGFPATVFIATRFCGRKNEWHQPGISIPSLPMLSWEEIEEMSRGSFEIGAHTHNHLHLSGLSPDVLREEVLTSKAAIEDKTGKPCHLFAYPFGTLNDRVKRWISSEFTVACTDRLGRVTHRSDPHCLERVDAGYAPHPSAFKTLITSSLHLYLPLKRIYRKGIGDGR